MKNRSFNWRTPLLVAAVFCHVVEVWTATTSLPKNDANRSDGSTSEISSGSINMDDLAYGTSLNQLSGTYVGSDGTVNVFNNGDDNTSTPGSANNESQSKSRSRVTEKKSGTFTIDGEDFSSKINDGIQSSPKKSKGSTVQSTRSQSRRTMSRRERANLQRALAKKRTPQAPAKRST